MYALGFGPLSSGGGVGGIELAVGSGPRLRARLARTDPDDLHNGHVTSVDAHRSDPSRVSLCERADLARSKNASRVYCYSFRKRISVRVNTEKEFVNSD